MAQNRQQLERQLRAGIRAARSDDRARARELLTGVLRADRSNELAWAWMAQVVDTRQERRRCLEEILKLNPGNRPARAALNQLVGVVGGEGAAFDVEKIAAAARTELSDSGQQTGARSTPRSSRGGGSRLSPMLLGLGGVAVLLIGLLVFTVAPLLNTPEPTATPTRIPPTRQVTAVVLLTDPATGQIITRTPTPTPIIPTATVGDIATRANSNLLQPTFTPTNTATPTETLTPTATLPPVNQFVIYYSAEVSGVSALYRMVADGSQNVQLANNIIDFDISPDGQQVAFTRSVAYGAGTAADGSVLDATTGIELFIAPLNNLDAAQQLTNIRVGTASSPTFVGGSLQIAYASDQDGDNDLYFYNVTANTSVPLTENDREDIDPDWSPVTNELVYASEQASIGNATLYTYGFNEDPNEEITQLLTSGAVSAAPAWSPDSGTIAYTSGRDALNIQVVDASGQIFRSLTTSVSPQYAPAWSPDGNYIAHAVDTDSGNRIDVITGNGRVVQSIDLEDQIVRDILVLSN